MSEIKLVWRTDVHMSDRAPSSRVDDWTETVFDKLGQVRDVAKAVGAAAVIDGGDFFHIKSPTRNSHETVRRVMDHHAAYGIPVYCTPGNHDAVYGDYTMLGQQPLGVLFSSGIFKRLYDEHEVYFAARHDQKSPQAYPYNRKGHWVRGNPFAIPSRDRKGPIVRVVGIPYHGTTYDMERFTSIERGEEDVLICVAHVLASLKGGTMFEGEDIVRYADLVDTAPDAYCYLPGTIITDWNGRALPIEEVGGSVALQGREGPVVVEQVHPVREVDEEVVTLDVEGVPSDLIPGVTAEHPFWVAKGLRCRLPSRSSRRCHPDKGRASYPCSSCYKPPVVSPDWCAAGEIGVGDYVALPYPKIPKDAISDPGLARLLGYYVAEGHLVENRAGEPVGGVGWSFHAEEYDLHADVGRLVRDHFGLEVKEHSLVKYGNRSVQVCAYGREIAEFFGEHGGRHAPRKTLSSWVWRLAASSRMELLVGWLLGDGHARAAKAELMGGTTSPRLATQMFLLALSVGLRPHYTIRPEGEVVWSGGSVSPRLPFHCITFYGDDAEMLSHRMGVAPPDRMKSKVSGFFWDGLFWRRVRGVSRFHYQGPVYNMRTSTEEYVAGLLLTHNCFGHWHKDQGVEEIGGKTFVNIGSLTRGALSQDEVQRRPACAILTCTSAGVEVQTVRLRVKPAEEVFDVEKRARQVRQQNEMDAFVTKIRESLVVEGDEREKDVQEAIEGFEDVPEEVRNRALHYLELADG